MKTFRSIFFTFFLAISFSAFAQSKTETIPVSGECGMCQTTIESSAKKGGAKTAAWNPDTKILTVTYNSSSTNAARIQKAVAGAGYDTRDVKASNEAYDKLHGCCKYERAASTASCCGEKACTEKQCASDGQCKKDMSCCKESGCEAKDCCKKA